MKIKYFSLIPIRSIALLSDSLSLAFGLIGDFDLLLCFVFVYLQSTGATLKVYKSTFTAIYTKQRRVKIGGEKREEGSEARRGDAAERTYRMMGQAMVCTTQHNGVISDGQHG